MTFFRKRLLPIMIAAVIFCTVNPYQGGSLSAYAGFSETSSGNSLSNDSSSDDNVSGGGVPNSPSDNNAEGDGNTGSSPVIIKKGVVVDSLSRDFSGRTAVLSNKKLILNALKNSDSAETSVIFNVGGRYRIDGIQNLPHGITVSEEQILQNGFPAIRLNFSSTPKAGKGNYKILLTPYEEGSGTTLSPVTLRLTVKKQYPSAAWEKRIITLTPRLKGDFALNRPLNGGISIAPINSGAYSTVIPEELSLTLDNENTLRISLKDTPKKKSYKINLWLLYTDYDGIKAVMSPFTIKIKDAAPVLRIKKLSGSKLDLSDRKGTAFHYSPLFQNTGYIVREAFLNSQSIKKNYRLDTISDPDTEEVKELILSALSDSSISPGAGEAEIGMYYGLPGLDTEGTLVRMPVRFRNTASQLKLKSVGGKKLIFSKSVSDNILVCYIDINVASPAYAAIDPITIEDISDKSKIPSGAFITNWTLDPLGQALRGEILLDTTKITPGKNYRLTYSMRAKGAPANKSTKITFSAKY